MIAVDIYEKDGFKYAYCIGEDIEYRSDSDDTVHLVESPWKWE